MKCEIVLELLIVFICADFLATPGCAAPVPANKGGFASLQGGNTWCRGSNSKCKFDMERRTRRLAVGDAAPVPETRLGSLQNQSKDNYPIGVIMTVEKKSAKKDVTTSSTLKIEATKSANVNKQNSELFKSQKKSKQETTVIAKNDDKPKDDVKPKDDAKVTENAKPEIDAKSKDIAKPKDDIKLKDGTKTNDDSVLKDDTKLKDDPKVKGAVPVAINSRSYIDNQSENHIEVIPKSTKSNQEEKIAIKRNPVDHPKQSEEPNQHQDPVVKPNIGKPGLKGLKKIIDDTLGEPKPSKPLIPSFKKPQINSCATLTTRRQLHEAGERISNLLGKLEQPHFNCALLNTEIETIKGMLQHVLIHTPADGKRKEVDRTKIIDQIKERQAKIHARFGHREIGKHGRLGMRKGIGREESVEDKSEVADLRGGKREIKTL